MEKATFAGGCFWCMEAAFKTLKGVSEVVSGYTAGKKKNPSYEEVSSGTTGHYEAVQITFNSSEISYRKLLDFFWKSIDPFDKEGQFVDKGKQYRTAVFYHNASQKKLAEKSKKEIETKFGKKVFTKILPASEFYKAEDYHQNYYKKSPVRYKLYEVGSGRKRRLKEIWEK